MLRTVIVDDEELILELLKKTLRSEADIDIVGAFTRPKEALAQIPQLKPDLVFLDIEMPGMNGIELATQILNENEDIGIVFVTAYDRYAVEAFRLNAIHYILKPPNAADIKQVLTRVVSDKISQPQRSEGTVYVRFFGELHVQDEAGIVMQWPTAKTEELFALFILNGDKGIDKWRIIDKLWPESQEGKCEQLLYTTVYRLKKTLAEHGIKVKVSNKIGFYRMKIEHMWCDVDAFEQLYSAYKQTQHVDDTIYDTLFNLYLGPLFGSKNYEWSELYKYELSRKFDDLLTAIREYYQELKREDILKDLQMKKEFVE